MTNEQEPTKFTRYVIYPLVILFFIFVFVALFISASGYKLTFENGKIDFEKTGMIIVATHPSGADIFINDKDNNRRTGFYFLPTKINNLLPGEYKLTLKKEGYRVWEDALKVEENIVTWANYVLLFKENLDFEKLNLPDKVEIVKNLDEENISNDILFKGKENNLTTLYYYDASRDVYKKIWPPEGQLTDTWNGDFQIVGEKFNKSNNKAVIYIKKGDIMEYDLIDFSKDVPSFVSLSLYYNKTFTNFAWDSANSSYLFALSGTDLYRIDTESSTIGDIVATNVVDFTVDKSKKVYYISSLESSYSLSRMNLDGSDKTLISEIVVKSKAYKISYSTNAEALAVLSYDDGKLYIYKNITGQLSIMRLSKDSLGFDWSDDGEKIFYYNDQVIKNYDLEKLRETQASVDSKIETVDWYFDNCHYLIKNTKGLFVMDFDGSNKIYINDSPVAQAINYINGEIIFEYPNNTIAETKKFIPAF